MKYTTILMAGSALFLGIMGIILSFAPEQLVVLLDQASNPALILFTQILGALYFGFGIMNWMGKTVLIGGIYARPLSLGNFAHFAIASLALIKAGLKGNFSTTFLWAISILYILFSILFGFVFFTNPKSNQRS